MKSITNHGSIVLITNGKYAGKYGIILKKFDKKNSKNDFDSIAIYGFKKSCSSIDGMKNQIKKFIKRKNLFSIFYKQVNTKHILFTEYKIHKVFSSEKLYDLLSNKISFNYGIKVGLV